MADDLAELLRTGLSRGAGRIAIREGDVVVTYDELEAHVRRIGDRLRELLPDAEAIVALEIERSWRLVAAAIATVCAGFAFVVIDPAFPRKRRDAMHEQVRAAATLSWPEGGAPVAERLREIAPGREQAFSSRLAYAVCTSGSTGVPKALGIERATLARLLRWHLRTYGSSEPWRAAQVVASSFDVFVWDVFGTVAGGADLDIVHEDCFDAYSLWRKLAQVDIAVLPAALIHMLVAEEALQLPATRLKYLVSVGERLLARPSMPRTWRLHDAYGPAECTVVSTSTAPMGDASNVPVGVIGTPIDGARITIVDEDLKPVRPGEVGEIVISGQLVGRGYLGDERQTAAAFLRGLPFLANGQVAYRSGDLGRQLDGGAIEFHGRRDHQIKLRGYRIELGDIEAALCSHALVHEAVAGVIRRHADDLLVAVVSVKREADVDRDELLEHVAQRLPPYMVPAAVEIALALPRSQNGKIDRGAVLAGVDGNLTFARR